MEGRLRVTGMGFNPFVVKSNEMFIMPAHTNHQVEVEENSSCVRLYIIGDNLDFCNRIVSDKHLRKMAKQGGDFFALPMLPVVRMLIDQISVYAHDRLLCCDIHTLKQRELSAVIQAYYKPSVLQRFLVPLYRSNSSFLHKVISLAHYYLNVDQMAERLNMSRSTFVRNFTEQFKEPPGGWLTRVRAKSLYRELRFTDASLEEISVRLKFSSPQNMSNFCRKNIGGTPMQVRAGEVKEPPELLQAELHP